MKKTVIFLGKSGSGKGTQANLLLEHFQEKGEEVEYIETGQRFRDYIKKDTYSSKLSKKIMDEGGLQPAFLAVHMWSHDFIDLIKENNHLIIDGSPRKHIEARILVEALQFYGREVEVVNINVSREWATKKLLGRGRKDDNEEDIHARLDWYETDVAPALEHLRLSEGVTVHDINGEQTIEEEWNDVKEALGL